MTNESEETISATSEQPEGEQGAQGEGTGGETSQEAAAAESGSEPVGDRQQRRDERLRERATTAEARATTAEATVERLVRGEVIRSLAGRVSDPEAALRLGEVDVRDLLTDDGDVDTAEVEALANGLVAKYPSLQPRTHHGDIGAKSTQQQGRSVSWSEVLKSK